MNPAHAYLNHLTKRLSGAVALFAAPIWSVLLIMPDLPYFVPKSFARLGKLIGQQPASAFRRALCFGLVLSSHVAIAGPVNSGQPLRVMPLGDSITRGSYLVMHESGPQKGRAIARANEGGGGWRKLLQDMLRADGVPFDFVGELSYHSFGHDGKVDPSFDPDHHGLAGFSNSKIISGGKVPTPQDVLDELGVSEVTVPDIQTVLKRHRPDIILLMSGANGFDAAARDELVRLIGANSPAHLFVATILPQRAPRVGWEKVDDYNSSLPAIVAAQQARGLRITIVDMHAAIAADDLLADGVHPNREGLAKIAAKWYAALKVATYVERNNR
jgi:hypothetical protein